MCQAGKTCELLMWWHLTTSGIFGMQAILQTFCEELIFWIFTVWAVSRSTPFHQKGFSVIKMSKIKCCTVWHQAIYTHKQQRTNCTTFSCLFKICFLQTSPGQRPPSLDRGGLVSGRASMAHVCWNLEPDLSSAGRFARAPPILKQLHLSDQQFLFPSGQPLWYLNNKWRAFVSTITGFSAFLTEGMWKYCPCS